MRATRKQVVAMKTLQRKAGMDDESWRAFLGENFGVQSCTALEVDQVDVVMEHFEMLGVTQRLAHKSLERRKQAILGRLKMKKENEKLLTLTAHLLAETGKRLEYANGIARRIWGVDSIQWLDKKQLYYLNNQLMRYKKGASNG